MKVIYSLLFLICCGLVMPGCDSESSETTPAAQAGDSSDHPGGSDSEVDTDAETGTDTTDTDSGDSESQDSETDTSDGGDTDAADETQADEGGASDTGESNIDVHGSDSVSCDGTPEAVIAGVVGRAIQCQLDHHDGLTTASQKTAAAEESAEEEEDGTQPETGELGEPILFVFDPSGWDLDALEEDLLEVDASNSALVVSHGLLRDFIYEAGVAPGVNDIDGAVQALSDSFADAIVGETHSCVSTYLRDYEVLFDCLEEPTQTLTCGEAAPVDADPDAPCSDHNGSVADWVETYLGGLGLLTGSADLQTVFEGVVAQDDFSISVLAQKITVADLRFYQYYYAKRDWALPNSDTVQESFLNPNNWAGYPLISQSAEDACSTADIPRCCQYETFISAYDSSPWELLASVNSCTNEFAAVGPYENSQLYKILLLNDGSVGNDGAFTIDEFFRPFILHYEKTTAPEHRGVCYWTALREFAARTIMVDAGNAAGQMTAQDMDAYIQSYNTTIAAFDGLEPGDAPLDVCEAPAN